MKQVKPEQLKADEQLLFVAKWTIQMLDQSVLVYGGNNLTSTGFDEFYDWAAAVRAVVALSEIGDDSPQELKKTHADVELPRFKEDGGLKQICVVK